MTARRSGATEPVIGPSPGELVLALLEARADQLAEAMLAACLEEIPEFGAIADPAAVAEVRAHSLEHVRMFLRAVRRGRPPRGSELEFVYRRARTRARQGMPVDVLLHAYRLGQREVWKAVTAASAEVPDAGDAALTLSYATMTYTDAISAAVGAAYVDAQNRMLADAERRKCELLDDLLAKGAKVGDEESARAAGLGLDLDREYVVVVAVVTDSGRLEGDAALRVVEAAVLRSQPAFLPRPWAVVMRGALIAVIGCGDRGAAGATERIAPQVGQLMEREGLLVAVGVSATRSRLAEVAAGYDEALQAIRHATTERPTVAIEDIPLFDYLVAYGQESARRIVAPELVELATAKGSVAALAETALAYLDCGLNAERTAQRLYVHPNTVHYRLARLTELTGRDPHLPADLLEIVAAIRVVRQAGAALGTVPKSVATDSESRPMTRGASAATLRHVRRLHSVGAGS